MTMHATREVQDHLLSAVNEGEIKCRNFVNSALTVGQSVSFHSPISKSQLKTFEHMILYRSNTSATVCAFAKHDVNCLQYSVARSPKVLCFFASIHCTSAMPSLM
jgi:hypothetical protein